MGGENLTGLSGTGPPSPFPVTTKLPTSRPRFSITVFQVYYKCLPLVHDLAEVKPVLPEHPKGAAGKG